ncbi:MAG: protein kinase, partial [Rhodospirillales bacterium]|nr:protein kinase [Rhodospirillales bacterium]
GEVYQGRWLEHEVAIKMLKGKLSPAQEAEFIREVKIMKSCAANTSCNSTPSASNQEEPASL